MMTQAFYTGISGLQNYSEGINVVSNNIANMNSAGFRGYNPEFSNLFENSINATVGPLQNSVGEGTHLQTTTMIQEQGPLEVSDRNTDLAIVGDGWFGVANGSDGTPLYTRNGAFSFDANGDLVTDDGFYVLGTIGDNITQDNTLASKIDTLPLSDIGSEQKLRFPKTLTYPSVPTKKAQFFANLGIGSEPLSISAKIVDSKNNQNRLRLEFVKNEVQTPPGSQYTLTATVESSDSNRTYDTQTGIVKFDAQGALVSNSVSTINNNGSSVSIDLGSGYDGVTAIDREVVPGSSKADGTIGGDLEGYAINKNAEVVATFTNGEQSVVGKIAVHHFMNNQGLHRISGTYFQESSNSGKAHFIKDAKGKNINGSIVKNFRLEGSNVKMSSGLTELLVMQRSYDANSKSITTADEMVKKALNMGA